MSKKLTGIVLLFCLIAGCAPLNYFKAPDMLKVKRIAVLNLKESPGNNKVGGGAAISEGIINEITRLGRFVVVEGTQKEEILKQQVFEQSGAVNIDTAKEVGKMLGVDAVIVGHVPEYGEYRTSWGSKNWFWGTAALALFTGGLGFITFVEPWFPEVIFAAMVNVRVVSVETGEILYTKSARATGYDFLKVIDAVCKEAVSDLK